MSNGETQPDDATPSASNESNELFVNIEALLVNPDISHPTGPSTDSNITEEMPSIFGEWKSWDHFGFSEFLPEAKKWQFVAYMKRWCNLNILSFIEEFQGKEDLLWSYYRGVDEQLIRAENNNRFIQYLLVNSCFLIFAMVLQDQGEILNGNNGNDPPWRQEFENLMMCILRDKISTQQYMLTMEYQIPWFVVEAVYTKHSNLSSKHPDTPIHKHALLFLEDIYPVINKSKVIHDTITLPPGGFKHLLHILHWSRTTKDRFLLNYRSWPAKKMDSFYIPSATELQLSETIFKKHPHGSTDVGFSKGRLSGVMEVAPLHLLPYSTRIYKSLLRFEWEYSERCGLPFTSYVTCMVCLVQTEEDVKLLRANGIIPRTRNGENDVLRSVQQLKDLLDDTLYMQKDLDILSENVLAHYQRRDTRFYGELKSRYCPDKWILISVIAGILLFVLTIIQTVLSFIQTKYSVLSYKKQ